MMIKGVRLEPLVRMSRPSGRIHGAGLGRVTRLVGNLARLWRKRPASVSVSAYNSVLAITLSICKESACMKHGLVEGRVSREC